MSHVWKYLQMLTRYPHRGSATPLERAAAEESRQVLSALGYTAELQPFSTPRDTLYLGPGVVMLGFLGAALAGSWLPWAGVLLCLLCLLPMIGELLASNRLDFDLILPLYPSQNVVARLPGRAGARKTLVISGHYDTQRASYLFHPLFAPFIQVYFYLVYAGLLAIPVALFGKLFWPGALWPGVLLSSGCIATALNAAFLFLCRFTGGYINGANDNGSGAALVLALAERYAANPIEETDVIFLLTGAEEVGTRGMKHFMRSTQLDRASTRFINLDNLGSGNLHYLAGEGMLAYYPYNAQMRTQAEQLAPKCPGGLYARKNLLLPTDGLIPLVTGYQAISFLAFGPDGRLPHYHWYTDRLEAIDQKELEATEEFFWQYIQALCRCRSEAAS